LPTAQKIEAVAELARLLNESRSAILLDYRGLDVAEISALRRELSAADIEFHVAKNTLLRIAADQAGIDVSPDLLTGPTAVAFGTADEVAPAKLLTAYVRRNREVAVKGGILGKQSLDVNQVERFAELPSREVLLAQFLGAAQSPMAQVLGVVQAQLREVAGLALALRNKLEAAEGTAA